ncbi:DUF3624 family protein [Mesorhizobium sp. B3-2-1]|uniref:DUF3624 family protein n=1 Tax=Mesorhizobium sp. B3-2-1 TaxID=2589891 RepID=UPI0015E39F71|nr:DUF3624 family protein [Mesorhizobium sp. B3-2-1]
MSGQNIRKATASDALPRFMTRIGTCGICMRQAFLAAAIAWCLWLLALIASSSFSSSMPIRIPLAFAGLLTGLWLLHVVVFGIRIALYTTGKTEPSGGMEVTEGKLPPSRRAFFQILAKAIAGAVLATAIPSRISYAYGNCNDPNFYPCSITACVPSGSANACCPEGAQYLSHCDCQCYQSSADVNCGSYAYCH